MGQKVNPHGLRLGFNKNWTSHWFAGKEYALFLEQDRQIRELINKKYHRSGIQNIDIYRRSGELVISIHTSKPGIIIGRGGAGSTDLKARLEAMVFQNVIKSERPSLRLNIVEVKTPELSAKLVAENIAGQLERRIAVKRTMRQAVERTMERRAKGIKIKISGRLNGAEIARNESTSTGSVPLQSLKSDISYGLAEAHTTYGIIGVKVWIYTGDSVEMPPEAMEQSTRPQSRNRSR